MNDLMCHRGDDELMVILLDAPNRWVMRTGLDDIPATTLRQALCKAHEYSSQGNCLGPIVKQPNDEMVVDVPQISRLWKHLELPFPFESRPQ